MKVFHYTKLDYWESIAEEAKLKPKRRLGRYHDVAWNRHAIFALLSPRPNEWINNQDFTEGIPPWQQLHLDIGKLLLEITIDPSQVTVVDWGHQEGFFRGGGRQSDFSIPQHFQHTDQCLSEKAYVDSGMPLDRYLSSKTQYSLPEVLIEQEIPLSQVKISCDQSLLVEYWRQTFNIEAIKRKLSYMETISIPTSIVHMLRKEFLFPIT